MAKIQLKLAEHIQKLNIQQKEFAEMSGLREATISQMVNNKYDRLQLAHLLIIMETLKIEDFNQILEITED